jgi:hypothetical protein
MLGLHRLCLARWDVMGGEATCRCDSEKYHSHIHTGTFSPGTGKRTKGATDAHQ